uniref:7TM GPCR serpentine receptor class x (Srx) domain-containing protein n=1 Tax=Acrobeloides nanus TaxID=290746 RepID=A0A914ESB7_9BILA
MSYEYNNRTASIIFGIFMTVVGLSLFVFTITVITTFPDPDLLGPVAHHIGQLLIAICFSGSMLQSIIAVNRFLAIFCSKKGYILSRFTYNCIAIIVFPICLAMSYIPANYFFCCKYMDLL